MTHEPLFCPLQAHGHKEAVTFQRLLLVRLSFWETPFYAGRTGSRMFTPRPRPARGSEASPR